MDTAFIPNDQPFVLVYKHKRFGWGYVIDIASPDGRVRRRAAITHRGAKRLGDRWLRHLNDTDLTLEEIIT